MNGSTAADLTFIVDLPGLCGLPGDRPFPLRGLARIWWTDCLLFRTIGNGSTRRYRCLRVSAPDSFAWMHVAPAVPAFLRRFAELSIDITSSAAHVNLVDEGLDLAIRIGVLEDSPLIVRKLAPSRLVLCAAPAYLKEHGAPREPGDLAKHNCLCTSLLPWGGEWRLAGKRGEVRVAVGGSFRSNNAEMLRAAALDGIGIAVLPTWAVAEPLRTGALRRVLDAWEPPASTIYALYPGNRLMSMKVRAFVDHLARCFGSTPYWDEGL